MSDATDAVAQAQAALAAAQAAAAQEAAAAKAAGDSQAALAAEAALGKGIGPHIGDLIRRVEALEQRVFGQSEPEQPAQPASQLEPQPYQ